MNILRQLSPFRLGFSGKCMASRSGLLLSTRQGSFVSVNEDQNTRTATLVMNRPPVNSLNLELLQQLKDAIKDLEAKKFRGIIVSSSSPTVFSSGLDINEMYKPERERFVKFWTTLQNFWKTLYLTPLVTVAAINGHSPAGGCMISLSCDYRIMVNSKVTIGLNETKLGLAAPMWFQSLLINTIGFRKAEKALNLGTLFPPEEALSVGLVDELAADSEDLTAKAHKQMELWLKVPSAARQATKMALRKPFVDELEKYEMKEVDMVFGYATMDSTVKALGSYIESMKAKK